MLSYYTEHLIIEEYSILEDLLQKYSSFKENAFNGDNDDLQTLEGLERTIDSCFERLYNSIVCHIESIGLISYLTYFKNKTNHLLEDRSQRYKYETNSENDYCSFEITYLITNLLKPLGFNNKGFLPTKLYCLENILKNTQFILHSLNKIPKSEPEVYNTIAFVIKSVFCNNIDAGKGFFKNYKKFIPDIAIPELEVAIEYKYADNKEKLKKQIDEILIDSLSYSGNPNYKRFYAVFYVTEDFWGMQTFKEVWKGKFPSNWKGYYIVGKNAVKGNN